MSRSTSKKTLQNASGPTRREPRAWAWVAGVVGLVLLCFALVPLSPRVGYFGDHDDFTRWGVQAVDDGVLSLYEHPPPRVDAWYFINGKPIKRQRPVDRVCNYPPAAAYVLWINGLVHRAVDYDRTINTWWARAVFMIWGIIAQVIMAFGVAAIVRRWRGGRAPFVAYLITLYMPPLVYDIAMWGQTDTWLLAPAVWMLWALMERRWIVAGVCWGIMLGLKPQAVLFTPLWFVAAYGHRAWRGPLVGVASAVGALFLLALPFTIQSGKKWAEICYYENIVEAYPDTTLRAYNLWYVDLLLCEDRDSTRTLWSVQKDTWGKAFLLLGLAGTAFAVFLQRRSGGDVMLLVWTSVSLLAFFMLPTRVHERYIVLVFPFLTCCAMLRPILWPSIALLAVLSVVQMMHQKWLDPDPPERWSYFMKHQAEDNYQMTLAQFQANDAEPPSYDEFIAYCRKEFDAARAARNLPLIEWSLVTAALASFAYIVFFLLYRPLPASGALQTAPAPSRQRRA